MRRPSIWRSIVKLPGLVGVEALPDDLVGSFPSVEDLEAELALNGGADAEDEP